jgi:FtsZ-binding cell division protein ZapB
MKYEHTVEIPIKEFLDLTKAKEREANLQSTVEFLQECNTSVDAKVTQLKEENDQWHRMLTKG